MLKRIGVVLLVLVFTGLLSGRSQVYNRKTVACANDNELSFEGMAAPWYKYRKDGKAGRELMLKLTNGKLAGKIDITVACGNSKETTELQLMDSARYITVLLPAGIGVTTSDVKVTLRVNGRQGNNTVVVPALKQWTVYIYPHAHVDIGYTALQETVEKLQVRNIDVGIDLAKKTQHYPAGARFVWNPEATWVVSSYLKHATEEKRKKLVEAVRKGWVQIDGGHSNINTSTCSEEELMRMFRNQQQIQTITGVPVTTMVQMDLPGGSWGLVQSAVQNGIKGFISFPNYYDMRRTWEHKPFYWIAPDGKSKLLFLQATPYGIGYTIKGSKYGLSKIQSFNDTCDRLHTATPMKDFIDPFIFQEIARQEKAQSPYDIMAITWSMADNCLIDADLPEAVKEWNENYAYPKLQIAGAKEILQAYETKYSKIIPGYSGDFTEYWTDGLGSDARRVALSRRGKEDLVQAETLWAMLNKKAKAPVAQFQQGWENLLLAAEHTWGCQVPGTPLAKQVEGIKGSYFENAAKIGADLITKAVAPVTETGSNNIAVINTLSWTRTGLVVLKPQQSKTGDRVLNDAGKEVLSQRLTTGELIFQSGDIPALGSKTYRITPGKCSLPSLLKAAGNTLQNERLLLTIDEHNGNIKSLIDVKAGRQLVDTSSAFQLNSFNHVPGVYNGKDSSGKITQAVDVSVTIKEQGPLVVSLLVTSKANGCKWLTQEVKLFNGQAVIECVNTIDKLPGRQKEAIHYGFAFNVPAGKIKMDIPWGIMTPEKDQLPGANRNWLAFQRWIDVSNDAYGITWTALETPVVELSNITGTILDGARQYDRWMKHLPATQTIISWPVNNHWDTNFSPEQEGVITTTCRMELHGKYDAVAANRFGMQQHRPLIAVPVRNNPVKKPLVALNNEKVHIAALKVSDDQQAVIVRLRSVSEQKERCKLTYPAGQPKSVFICSPGEKPLQRSTGNIELPKYGTVSLRVVF